MPSGSKTQFQGKCCSSATAQQLIDVIRIYLGVWFETHDRIRTMYSTSPLLLLLLLLLLLFFILWRMGKNKSLSSHTSTYQCQIHVVFRFNPVAVVVVVFTLNRSFYPTSAVPPVSVLILYAREIQIVWSLSLWEKTQKKSRIIPWANQMLTINNVQRAQQQKERQPRK